MRRLSKLLLIGILTTVTRIIGQFLIPAGEQSVLEPSVFSTNGTMPIAFTIYGIVVYTIIAALFFLINRKLVGHKIWQGQQYGISCCLIWIVYLWEPLPHVAPLDRITYPIIDSLALLVMGLLLGVFFGEINHKKEKCIFDWRAISIITLSFVAGRLLQYLVFDIYASFETKFMETMLWTIGTGFIVALVVNWYYFHINHTHKIRDAVLVGGGLYGLDLLLFNFFMPLVFSVDIPDLIIRTTVDIIAVVLGSLSFMEVNKDEQKTDQLARITWSH